jgi:hypothetical protein
MNHLLTQSVGLLTQSLVPNRLIQCFDQEGDAEYNGLAMEMVPDFAVRKGTDFAVTTILPENCTLNRSPFDYKEEKEQDGNNNNNNNNNKEDEEGEEDEDKKEKDKEPL